MQFMEGREGLRMAESSTPTAYLWKEYLNLYLGFLGIYEGKPFAYSRPSEAFVTLHLEPLVQGLQAPWKARQAPVSFCQTFGLKNSISPRASPVRLSWSLTTSASISSLCPSTLSVTRVVAPRGRMSRTSAG